jgi:hypothetical protein
MVWIVRIVASFAGLIWLIVLIELIYMPPPSRRPSFTHLPTFSPSHLLSFTDLPNLSPSIIRPLTSVICLCFALFPPLAFFPTSAFRLPHSKICPLKSVPVLSHLPSFRTSHLLSSDTCPPFTLCPLPHALCPLPHALCPMPFSTTHNSQLATHYP